VRSFNVDGLLEIIVGTISFPDGAGEPEGDIVNVGETLNTLMLGHDHGERNVEGSTECGRAEWAALVHAAQSMSTKGPSCLKYRTVVVLPYLTLKTENHCLRHVVCVGVGG
jgi:hypothetical protein